MTFHDRQDAGKKLGEVLHKYKDLDVVVVGVPRGGVVVAAEVAKSLDASLDVIIPRKIGAPHNPEVAIGAVTQDGTVIKDEVMVQYLGLTDDQVNTMADQVSQEINRRVDTYRSGRPGADLHNKTVIVVDDGIATGFTIRAALQSVRNARPQRLVLAVPVAPPESLITLRETVDELVCLVRPESFYAVGQFYTDFDQTSDGEVIDLLIRYGNNHN